MNSFRPSPSRTYVIPVFNSQFTAISFKQFTLPSNEENTCEHATWYFYNRLDYFSCGRDAYPAEMHFDITDINESSRNKISEEELYSDQRIIEAIGRFNIEQKSPLTINMINSLARHIQALKNKNT